MVQSTQEVAVSAKMEKQSVAPMDVGDPVLEKSNPLQKPAMAKTITVMAL
jgi:hypothetical protein